MRRSTQFNSFDIDQERRKKAIEKALNTKPKKKQCTSEAPVRMNDQDKARTQLAELTNNHGIKLRAVSRTANTGIPYDALYKFFRGFGRNLMPEELAKVDKFYKAVKRGGDE